MDGILNINKPAGMTSHDVVDYVRRVLGMRKVGHTGTLDPQATGVLIILLGKATKLAHSLQNTDKEYEGEMTIGITTDTQDAQGKILKSVDKPEVSLTHLRNTFKQFTGKLKQIPPMVSAISIGGKRLYKLARQGIEIPRSPRQIEIYKLEILKFEEDEHPRVSFKVVCSKGTYIRTLCADIGDTLGYGAYQSNLVRTSVGKFKLKDAITLKELKKMQEKGEIEKKVWKLSMI